MHAHGFQPSNKDRVKWSGCTCTLKMEEEVEDGEGWGNAVEDNDKISRFYPNYKVPFPYT